MITKPRVLGRSLPARGWLLALMLVPLVASGQELADSDADGFSDVDEASGLDLAAGLSLLVPGAPPASFVPSCVESELPRSQCLDPLSPDLFVIVVPASPSLLPPDAFADTSAPDQEGGLGVTVHVLSAADPTGSRVVSPASGQNAVRITESLAAPGDKLGLANYGTPNRLDGATIFTQRIAEFVAPHCGAADDLCQTDQGEVGQAAVVEVLTRWVLNHELGHLFALTASYDKRFGGYHLKAGEDEVLTQFVDYDTNKKTDLTTFFVPSTYSDQSRADKQLR